MRKTSVERNTKETKIACKINVDGTGMSKINTGIGFFDHMLEIFSHHSLIDVELSVDGDTHVDFHHTDYFTPTRKLNADDVVFTFTRLFDVYNPYHFVGGGNYPYFQSIGLDQSFRSVSKTGEYQVTFDMDDGMSDGDVIQETIKKEIIQESKYPIGQKISEISEKKIKRAGGGVAYMLGE